MSVADTRPSADTSWGAVLCLSILTFVLIASEFMPVSLLSPIARAFEVTEGQAGFAITISGIFAIIASLLGNSLLASFDRRSIVLGYSVLLVVAGVLTAFAPNYFVFLLGRVLIGITIGGFWSASTAILAKLARPEDLSRAMAILQGGTALAAVLAAPFGSYFGGLFGWRMAFFAVVPVGLVGLLWQWIVLPKIKPDGVLKLGDIGRLFSQPIVAIGMLATAVTFMGQFSLATYVRPYLQDAVGFDVNTLSIVLLALGIGGFWGTLLAGRFVRDILALAMVGLPLILAALAVAFILFAGVPPIVGVLFFVWGIFTTPIPIVWGTWMARVIPDRLEAGGAAQVALIQLAIAFGAFSGGSLFDGFGWQSTFGYSACVLVFAGVISIFAREKVSHA